MRITQLEITDFRNLAQVAIEPGEGVNIIYGANALETAVFAAPGNGR